MNIYIFTFVFVTFYVVLSAIFGIFVHELGHLLAARMLNIRVNSLSVGFGPEIIGVTDKRGVRWKLGAFLLGGRCDFSGQECDHVKPPMMINRRLRLLSESSPLDRALVYVAGPLFNLGFAALLLVAIANDRVLLPFMSHEEATYGLPRFLAMFSVSLAAFNLIPLPPLDGGQLLLVGIEAVRGSKTANEAQLFRAGTWSILGLTIVALILFLSRITGAFSAHSYI